MLPIVSIISKSRTIALNYCVFSVNRRIKSFRVDAATTGVRLIVTEQCGESSLFTHSGHVTENSPLVGHIVWFWTCFERRAPLLGLGVLGAEWRIRLSRSGSNLIHGETLSFQHFHLNGQT